MESWNPITPSPDLKFEDSPAESFLSTPDQMYPPLFGSSASASTMNPLEIMTPQSFSDDRRDSGASASSPTPEPSAEKKTKKRKSWGQVLPEPKTSLPPRKRAKTEDEKEQRRVERVLRNRRAAQSSRERKRQEVEQLERRNKELENLVTRLMDELQQVKRTVGVPDPLRPTGVTFSHELFSSQSSLAMQSGSPITDLLASVSSPSATVNPASLSPSLSPIAEEDEDDMSVHGADAAPTTMNASSPDATQHPAAMLCQDLQCRSAEEPRSMVVASPQQPTHPILQMLLTCASATLLLCQRPLMQIALSLKVGFSLPPTPSILITILWLVTNPATSPSRRAEQRPTSTSTSTTSSTTTSSTSPATSTSRTRCTGPTAAQSRLPTPRSSSLRLKLLKKILTSSPNLARPLTDATMAALRLASSEGRDVSRASGGAEALAAATAATNGSDMAALHGRVTGDGKAWLDGLELPSREVLITLLWTLRVEGQKVRSRNERRAASSAMEKNPGRRSALDVAKVA